MPKDVPVRTAYSLLPRYVPRQKFQVDKAWSGLGLGRRTQWLGSQIGDGGTSTAINGSELIVGWVRTLV